LDLQYLIPLVISYALVDSIDPCFFAIYASILLSLGLINLNELLKASFLFISSVGVGYFILGFLIRSILQWTAPSRIVAVLMIVAYGSAVVIYEVIRLLKKTSGLLEFVCREDAGLLCRVVSTLRPSRITVDFPRIFKYAYLIVIGLVLSFVILPCSAGLYIVYNIVTTSTPVYLWIPLTLLYIVVFVSPLVLITLTLAGAFRVIKNLETTWSNISKYAEIAKLVGGVLAITTGIYYYFAVSGYM